MPKKKRTKAKKKPLNILLLEPNYRNKYPPIGLMKISTYHRRRGDTVSFFKGDLAAFVVTLKVKVCVNKLSRFLDRKKVQIHRSIIESYVKNKRLDTLGKIIDVFPKKYRERIENVLRTSAYNVPKDVWDRIYVTTLFTFYWNITIKTIEFGKSLVSSDDKVYVGGVMASLLKNEIELETNIKPIAGLLSMPGALDVGDPTVIDELPLDYSILDEIEYKYPTQSAYFTYMTKGCTRKCAFCSVPKLEPTYIEKVQAIDLFNDVKAKFGDQRNLMLMDNNVLASPRFADIVSEIKAMGFTRDAIYNEPNQLDLAISNLKSGINDRAYIKKVVELFLDFRRRLRGKTRDNYDTILKEAGISYSVRWTAKKSDLFNLYRKFKMLYELHRAKIPMKRYVDFNQGVDARYVTDENMALMAQIPIKPLRIAFDHIGIRDTYIRAVELAAKHGIDDLSNYILYNFQDRPVDFYERLRINVDLGKRLNVTIFSFPMKFVPLFGEEAKDRKHIGKHWNKKYLRAIQCILNTTKGIVAPGYDFFQMSFGANVEEFQEILLMPESYIINRLFFERNKMTQNWREDIAALDPLERNEALEIIRKNDFGNISTLSKNALILRLLSHYVPNIRNKNQVSAEVRRLRRRFTVLVKRNMFIDLTLTHDFEGRNIIPAA